MTAVKRLIILGLHSVSTFGLPAAEKPVHQRTLSKIHDIQGTSVNSTVDVRLFVHLANG